MRTMPGKSWTPAVAATIVGVGLCTLVGSASNALAVPIEPVCGDVNLSGSIVSSDALLILKTAVGQPTEPVCIACTTIGTWGNDFELPDSTGVSGPFLIGFQIEILGVPSVVRFGVVSKTSDAQVRMALYSDNAGSPDKLVLGSDTVELEEGSHEIAVPLTPLAPGKYWLMGNYDKTVVVAGDDSEPGAVLKFRAASIDDPLPATFGASSTLTGLRLSYYVKVVN